jgi:hypothetical protein
VVSAMDEASECRQKMSCGITALAPRRENLDVEPAGHISRSSGAVLAPSFMISAMARAALRAAARWRSKEGPLDRRANPPAPSTSKTR